MNKELEILKKTVLLEIEKIEVEINNILHNESLNIDDKIDQLKNLIETFTIKELSLTLINNIINNTTKKQNENGKIDET
jgi:hypothetical protein